MPSFADALNLKPFIDKELGGELKAFPYLTKKGRLVQGYRAEVPPPRNRSLVSQARARAKAVKWLSPPSGHFRIDW